MGKGFFRNLLALLLILVGGTLILANLEIIDMDVENAWLYIYPIIFILFGMKWMIDRMRYKGGSWLFGSFFFIFGSLLMLDRFYVITFYFKDVYKLWPLLIIYFGFLFIGSSRKRIHISKGKKNKMKNDSSFSLAGDYEYNQPNWKVEPMNLKSLAGDFYLDFSKAFIPEKEIPIAIKSLAGDVHILIPENIEFRVEAYVKAGEIDVVGQKAEGVQRSLSHETPDYDSAVRKLDLFIDLKAGSVRVVKV
ncbi:cell wall-active antibiotics response protein LiaF [Virgibacillus doumboii]|uniref:cell wall-active antibiotics response protein LiaF n=1 Tax=Virgibacillus doumboii TaxID=2697503 RepID=UPI0013DFBE55|nr:cell wall-active antibiotics response protein LiaF [Virgibacillus doumboii]